MTSPDRNSDSKQSQAMVRRKYSIGEQVLVGSSIVGGLSLFLAVVFVMVTDGSRLILRHIGDRLFAPEAYWSQQIEQFDKLLRDKGAALSRCVAQQKDDAIELEKRKLELVGTSEHTAKLFETLRQRNVTLCDRLYAETLDLVNRHARAKEEFEKLSR